MYLKTKFLINFWGQKAMFKWIFLLQVIFTVSFIFNILINNDEERIIKNKKNKHDKNKKQNAHLGA